MIIQKKSIRNPDKYLGFLRQGSSIVIGVRNIGRFHELLRTIGFSDGMRSGETILPPAAFGPNSQFNSNGKYLVHKDRKKENRYVRTVWWEWEQWAGYGHTEHHEDWKDIYQWCYPRTFIEPPSVQLILAKLPDGNLAVTSSAFDWELGSDEPAKHIINLFLEIFGEAEIFTEDLQSLAPAKLIRLNWEILPKGQMPWEQLRKHMKPIIDKTRDGSRRFAQERLEALSAYSPDFTAVGRGGFHGYVVFGFDNKNTYIVESGHYGNATYVFGNDWEQLAQLTKKEVLDGKLEKARIIHSASWFKDINKLLKTV